MRLYCLRNYYIEYLEDGDYKWAVLANNPQEALNCLREKDILPTAMEYFKEPWNFENYKLDDRDYEYRGSLKDFMVYICYKQSNDEIIPLFSITELGELTTSISINKPRILI